MGKHPSAGLDAPSGAESGKRPTAGMKAALAPFDKAAEAGLH